MTSLRLPVRQSGKADEGRALARISLSNMQKLGVGPGDPLIIRMAEPVHARAVPALADFDGIAIDEMMLQSAGGAWGEEASIDACTLPELTSVLVDVEGKTLPAPSELADPLFDLPLTEGSTVLVQLPLGKRVKLRIVTLDPSPAGLFSEHTALSIAAAPGSAHQYEGVGGLQDQIARVHEMVATPLQRPDLFARLGITAPRGILFTGPPGSGKTLLARAVASRTEAAFYHIAGPEIVSKHYGESEAALRKVFEAAERDAPSIVFIDELDAVAPRRDGLSGEKQVERRVVAQLLTLLDGLKDRGRVVVMAATNLPEAIDPALRRPGRFDREIVFHPPGREARKDILSIHLADAPLDTSADLESVAGSTHGYVGADLAALAREAALAALNRSIDGRDLGAVKTEDVFITQADLMHGLAVTQPSLLRDTFVDLPETGWSDVGGMEEAKRMLHEAVLWPLAHPDGVRDLKVRPARGILLSGPPGTGKTLLARALAGQSRMNFIAVSATRILSQFLGEAERSVADLFTKARQAAPTILFFDEIDAIAACRGGRDSALDRIVAQLLVEMDGMSPNEQIVVLAATNRAAAVDPALRRPGRFDLVVEIPTPDEKARREILNVHLAGRSGASDLDLFSLAQASEGMTGADIQTWVDTAARTALARKIADAGVSELKITPEDFRSALTVFSEGRKAVNSDFIAEMA